MRSSWSARFAPLLPDEGLGLHYLTLTRLLGESLHQPFRMADGLGYSTSRRSDDNSRTLEFCSIHPSTIMMLLSGSSSSFLGCVAWPPSQANRMKNRHGFGFILSALLHICINIAHKTDMYAMPQTRQMRPYALDSRFCSSSNHWLALCLCGTGTPTPKDFQHSSHDFALEIEMNQSHFWKKNLIQNQQTLPCWQRLTHTYHTLCIHKRSYLSISECSNACWIESQTSCPCHHLHHPHIFLAACLCEWE